MRYSGILISLIVLFESLLALSQAKALEEVQIKIPLSSTTFKVRLDELSSHQSLHNGTSDLARLNRASGGLLGHLVRPFFSYPLPPGLKQLAHVSLQSPLFGQVIFLGSLLYTVEESTTDLGGHTDPEFSKSAVASHKPTLLRLIKEMPGQRITFSLGRIHQIMNRMLHQHKQADALLAAALSAAGSGSIPNGIKTGRGVVSRVVTLNVSHRSVPLEVTLVEPSSGSTGRLVLISHGLWDSPSYFEGWAILLASRGYTVLLPRHPGSDISQQQDVLAGQAPPPGPEEHSMRPKDLSALIDAVASRALPLTKSVAADRVVVLGHSWGATTALQLAGLRPSDKHLLRRCPKVNEPARNLSWILQCSWLKGIQSSVFSDPRVIAVGAVSPPGSLVFPRGSGASLSGRFLLVSGSRDWVVPPDTEAISPMRRARRGNQLMLVKGGDHFNLRPGKDADGGLLGRLLLAWTDAAFAAGRAVRPRVGAAPLLRPQIWGTADYPIVDVTGLLPGLE